MALNFMKRSKTTPCLMTIDTDNEKSGLQRVASFRKNNNTPSTSRNVKLDQNAPKPKVSLVSLPSDVLARIFVYIDYTILHRDVVPTCRRFQKLIYDPTSFMNRPQAPRHAMTQPAAAEGRGSTRFLGFGRSTTTPTFKTERESYSNRPATNPNIQLNRLNQHLFLSQYSGRNAMYQLSIAVSRWPLQDVQEKYYKLHPCLEQLFADYAVLSHRPMQIGDVGFLRSKDGKFIPLREWNVMCRENAISPPKDNIALTCSGVFRRVGGDTFFNNPFCCECEDIHGRWDKQLERRNAVTVAELVARAVKMINGRREKVMEYQDEDKRRKLMNWPNDMAKLFENVGVRLNYSFGGVVQIAQVQAYFPCRDVEVEDDVDDCVDEKLEMIEMVPAEKRVEEDEDEGVERTDWEVLHKRKYSQLCQFGDFDGVHCDGGRSPGLARV